MFALPLLAIPWHPGPQPRLAVKEYDGQLRITWNPATIAGRVNLEIQDGAAHIVIPVSSLFWSATYQPRTGDVQIRLGPESARFVGAPLTPSLDPTPGEIARLESEARKLRAIAAARRRRIAELQKILSTMDLDH